MSTAIDYSPIPKSQSERFQWSALAQLLSTVRHAASRDTTRYNLNTLYLELDENTLRATATDGHRLAQASIEVPEGSVSLTENTFLLTLSDADRLIAENKRLVKIHGKHRAKFLRVCIVARAGELAFETYENEQATDPIDTIRCKPQEGTFPNYRQVIGTHKTKGALDGAYVAEMAKALGALNERHHSLKISIPADPEVSPWRFDAVSPEGVEAFAMIMPVRL